VGPALGAGALGRGLGLGLGLGLAGGETFLQIAAHGWKIFSNRPSVNARHVRCFRWVHIPGQRDS
jgi:hypothetical protein